MGCDLWKLSLVDLLEGTKKENSYKWGIECSLFLLCYVKQIRAKAKSSSDANNTVRLSSEYNFTMRFYLLVIDISAFDLHVCKSKQNSQCTVS